MFSIRTNFVEKTIDNIKNRSDSKEMQQNVVTNSED